MNTIWTTPAGRELDATPLPDTERGAQRIVACLNVWNDAEALRQTIPILRRYVSQMIVVDGAYAETGASLSTDGTRDYLGSLPGVTLLDAAGVGQCEKRTRYFRAGRPGDMMLIIDADETLLSGERLSAMPMCDVGWVRILSKLYQRTYGQPRLIRWQPELHYRGRHHWIYCGDRLLCTHQYGGTGYAHRPVDITLHNQRHLGRSRERLAIKQTQQQRQNVHERIQTAIPASVMSDAKDRARESLQILMHVYRDDGLAPSRLHSAINRTTPHSSVFFKVRPGPFEVPDQYMTGRDAIKLASAFGTADVIHYHTMMSPATRTVPASRTMTVFHHHGSLLRAGADAHMRDAKARNALVLLSNLELFSWTNGAPAHFLPNTVPVARYAELRRRVQQPFTGAAPFRIAHSPSQPHRKGTEAFLRICDQLKLRGIPVEPVVLHNLTHRDVLAQKATCHAMFDSFWLGMQCSGIEAAAMGLLVIAGDETVAERYREYFGEVPYTFANTEAQLEDVILRLLNDADYREREAARVERYVREHHDESAVALRYLDLLDYKFGWRANLHVARPAGARRPASRVAR